MVGGRSKNLLDFAYIRLIEGIPMTRSEKYLCALYAIIAIVSIIATWSNNVAAFINLPETRTPEGLYHALYVNYATASFINDLFGLGSAACVFIFVEGRRLHIRYFWLYILLSGPTAISFTFPLFLIARQMKIAQQRASASTSQT
jgi:hypothetical protein